MKRIFLFNILLCLFAFVAVVNASTITSPDVEKAEALETDELCAGMEMADVTFCVDLSCFAVSDAAAVAFGPAFAPTNFLSDPDQDRIYCGTFSVPAGPLQYKYFFAQEQFETLSIGETGECIDGSGNRTLTVVDGVPQMVNDGWESCDGSCSAETTTGVTFCVDLSCFAVSDAVAVAFAPGFAPTNFMSDPDGDRTYCGTFDVPAGTVEYKYFFAQEQFEDLSGAGACVNAGGNRTVSVTSGVTQTVNDGWESCDGTCSAETLTDVTFCVDLSCFAVSDAVAVAFEPGFSPTNFMSDPDGDRIYCGTFGVPAGTTQYKYFFAQEQFEDLGGAGDCINAGGNRTVTVADGVAQTVNDAWESCDGVCVGPPQITFCVDMNCSGLNPTNVNIFGQFNGFNPFVNPMQDFDGDGVYCTTIPLAPGNQEYLFLADGVAESFNVGDPCTVSCCGGAFTNRLIVVEPGVDQSVQFDWESCDATCPPAPWKVFPDGVNCIDGSSASYDSDTETFTLESAGCAASSFNSDRAAYLAYDICGNAEIIARVTSISPFGQGWAGITMRESDAGGAKKVALSTNLGNFGRREVRTMTNGFAFPQQFFRPNAPWLRLVRNGNQFIGYMSTNGMFWQQVMVANVNMSSCIQLGLFVTNTNSVSTVAGTFDNVMASDPVIPSLIAAPNFDLNAGSGELSAEDIEVYPNPTTNEVYLDLNSYNGQKVQIDLLNALGNEIQSRQLQEVNGETERFDLSGLNSGIYFIRVRAGGEETTKRFLKIE